MQKVYDANKSIHVDKSIAQHSNLDKGSLAHSHAEKPWYHHAWLWFVLGLPAIVVIASIFTMIIAFQQAPQIIPNDNALSLSTSQATDNDRN